MERNPYLLLGLPFGASREDANVAFARRARVLRRRGEAGRDALIELTWALNQIDEAIRNPTVAIDVYRVPADPGAFEAGGPGIFTPAPERLARRQPPSEEALVDLLGRAAQELLVATISSLSRATELPSF